MRILLAGAALLAAVGCLWWLRSDARPVDAGSIATLAGELTIEPTPPPVRGLLQESPREAIHAHGTARSAIAEDPSGDCLAVVILEARTRRPFPEATLEVRAQRPNGTASLSVRVQPDARALVPVHELIGAQRIRFAVRDPIDGEEHVLEPCPVDRLLCSAEAVEILVPRRVWRDLLVVDPDGVPIAGAQVAESVVWDASGAVRGGVSRATTGPDGRARVFFQVPPGTLDVCAPGFRLEQVQVAAEDVPWIVRLARVSRIEVVLTGSADTSGFHVEVRLPASFRQRTFHQQKYVTTPGRVVEGTAGWWASGENGSTWSLGFAPDRRAVLDQLFESGTIVVALRRFGVEVARREVELRPAGGTLRLEFAPPPVPPELSGCVVDAEGHPIPSASIRLAPHGGRTMIDERHGYPIWAPATTTGADGNFRIARPDDDGERCVLGKRGFADRVLTIAEIDALARRIRLDAGRVVVLEAVDRNGEPIDGGWSSGIDHNYARPSVHLGHDVWRAASAHDHPAAEGRTFRLPFFLFADLPAGMVRIRFTHLSEDELLVHDTRIGTARYVSPRVVEELGIGK